MKANEAPEKIYIQPDAQLVLNVMVQVNLTTQ